VNDEATKVEQLTPSIDLGTGDPKNFTHLYGSEAVTILLEDISVRIIFSNMWDQNQHHCRSARGGKVGH
jgi:hypothetical protein